MLNKLCAAIRSAGLIVPGDRVSCAVSGGADSVALLFGLWLLREKLDFTLAAAHFNHHLRAEESDADEAFVRDFCERYEIPLTVGGARVVSGKKGLEAAARDARYAFLNTIPGKIATAHTADDNAETILMHMLRGTGLRGLGGIAPVNGRLIRPMLGITREDVIRFLDEYGLPHREDSSNTSDAFLRNRIRHKVIPLLKAENPSFAENASAMAGRLRLDESYIEAQLPTQLPAVSVLRQMPEALRMRCLERFLKENRVPEPEQAHLELIESLVYSDCPSACADLPGDVRIMRCYDTLTIASAEQAPDPAAVPLPGAVQLPRWGIMVSGSGHDNGGIRMAVSGELTVRSRRSGDSLRTRGGTKTVKKWMIDQKIPASRRAYIPVLADAEGVLYIPGAGPNLDRLSDDGMYIRVDPLTVCNDD